MAPKQLPPVEYLRKLFLYNPETGSLVWKERPVSDFKDGTYPAQRACNTWNGKWAGKEALNSPTNNGYLHGAIDYQSFLKHRVIWKFVTGQDPIDIDHANGIRKDNRFANLADCTRRENMRNRGIGKSNTSGHIGIYKSGGKWTAQIEHDGITENLGAFQNLADAVAARKEAEARLGFHPNHGTRNGHAIAAANLR